MMDGFACGSDVDSAVVLTGNYGRIDEELKRDGLEGDLVAGLAGDGQGRAKLPALRQKQLGLKGEARGRRAGGVEQDLIPFKDREHFGGGVPLRLNEIVGSF